MALTHVQTLNWTRNGEQITKNVTLTGDSEANLSLTVPGSTTDYHALLQVDVSAIQSLYIYSDVTVTIETNSGSAPDNTLTVTGGKPIIWYTGCGWTCPLTVDIDDIYVTRGTSGAAAVEIRILQDGTP